VLWLTVAGSELTPLAHAAGAGAEARPYTAHLTLARFPREEPGLAARWTERLSSFASRSWQATEVALMTSEREPGGPLVRPEPCLKTQFSGLVTSMTGSGCSPWRP
jgi:2'-5' RNA ligase